MYVTPILAQRLGTDRSFERLYRKHAGDVYRYALVVLRNEADAEDVTQTTFLNAYKAFERGERPRAPQNWLIAIAHNVCRQRFRQSQRRPNEVVFEEELAEATVVEDDALSAEDIRRALGHLAFNQRAALVMRELEGRSYQEIAEILELSVSAVETLIFRARRALREQLEEGITCHEAEFAISTPARRTPRPQGARRAARPPARVRGMRRLRPQPAGPARLAEVARPRFRSRSRSPVSSEAGEGRPSAAASRSRPRRSAPAPWSRPASATRASSTGSGSRRSPRRPPPCTTRPSPRMPRNRCRPQPRSWLRPRRRATTRSRSRPSP